MKITQIILECPGDGSSGKHTWVRPPELRGRNPNYCPEHRPVKEDSPMVTVVCEVDGHEYDVPRRQGWHRRKRCPNHDGPPLEPEAATIPEPHVTLQTSKGCSVWLSNEDQAYLKKKLRNDNSVWAERILRELC